MRGRSAEITARPGMIASVLENVDQNTPRGEVEKALKKLKAGKAAELNGLTTKCLRLGKTRVVSCWLEGLRRMTKKNFFYEPISLKFGT